MNNDNEIFMSARNHGEYAWPALLLIFLILGGLPQGPAPGCMAAAGEKAGGKAVPREPEQKSAPALDPDFEVGGSPDSPASTLESVASSSDSGTPVPEEHLPSTPEDLDQIEQQAEGLLAGKKFDAAADFIRENEAALAVSFRLKQMLLEALIQTEMPNWLDVGNRAQALIEESPADPVGNLALGMSWANRKTPDVAKALTYLAKAKDSKRALPMAVSLYWKVWAKKNWYVIAGLVALVLGGGFAIIRSRKRRRQAEEELVNALGENQPAQGRGGSSEPPVGAEPRPAARSGTPQTAPKTSEKPSGSGNAASRTDQKSEPEPEPEMTLEPAPEPAVEKPEPMEEGVTEGTGTDAEQPSGQVLVPVQGKPPAVPVPNKSPSPAPEVHAAPRIPPRATVVPAAVDFAAANLEPGGLSPTRPPH
nr:hypothetical protein [Candidatus Ozemobacteraceae bacterium]